MRPCGWWAWQGVYQALSLRFTSQDMFSVTVLARTPSSHHGRGRLEVRTGVALADMSPRPHRAPTLHTTLPSPQPHTQDTSQALGEASALR